MAAGKAEQEFISKWEATINLARELRRPYIRNWNYWEQVFDDNLFGESTGRFESFRKRRSGNALNRLIQVNAIQPIIETTLAETQLFSPIFSVQAVPPDDIIRWSALIWETLADRFYDIYDIDDKTEEITIDTMLLGGGVSKVGYDYQIETSEYTQDGSSVRDDRIFNNSVFISDVEPQNLLIDSRVKRWQDKRWIGEEIMKPLEEVQKSNLYENTKDIKATIKISQDVEGITRKQEREAKEADDELVRLVEIHDLQNQEIITLADGHNRVLRRDPDYGQDIYTQLTFTKSRPRRVWGKSTSQAVEEHAIALTQFYYYLLAHGRKSGITKVLIEASQFNKVTKDALKSPLDMEIVPLDGISSGNPPVQELKLSGPSQDAYANLGIIQSVIDQASGVSRQDRGKHEPGVRTAFEVSALSQGSDDRNNYRIKKIDNFIATTMSKMLRLANDNMAKEQIAQLVGLPQEFAFMIQPFDQMNLSVKFGSTAADAKQQKLNRLMAFAQLATQMQIPIKPQTFIRMASDALGLELWEQDLVDLNSPQEQGGSAPAGKNPMSVIEGGNNAAIQL